MDIKILYEDRDLAVLDKPSGVVVNRAESVKDKTVQDFVELRIKNQELRIKNPKVSQAFVQRSGIVHRLDKETSGCLIVAKTPEAFEDLQTQFKERKVKKEYLALVHGKIKAKDGIIKAPVGRISWDRQKFGVVPEGRMAVSRYRVEKYYERKGEKYTLVRVYPKTGRTHQIRVHMKYLGHPIVADGKYVGRKMYKEDKTFCPRLFLHAAKVSFVHPTTKRRISVKAELDKDLTKAVATF